jgi:hypothetical protein
MSDTRITPNAAVRLLDPDHYCDRCTARYAVMVVFGPDGEHLLQFCGHHARANLVELNRQFPGAVLSIRADDQVLKDWIANNFSADQYAVVGDAPQPRHAKPAPSAPPIGVEDCNFRRPATPDMGSRYTTYCPTCGESLDVNGSPATATGLPVWTVTNAEGRAMVCTACRNNLRKA